MKLKKDRRDEAVTALPIPEQQQPQQQPQDDLLTQKKEKRRFSGFWKKKDKEAAPSDTTTTPSLVVTGNSNSSHVLDSAYASSDAGHSQGRTSSSQHIVPLENHGQVAGVGQERNLTLNRLTGDVQDEGTGEVVSTVTTTTTTTTTTTSKGGKKEVTTEVASNPSPTPAPASQQNRDSIVSEMPADPVPPRQNGQNGQALTTNTPSVPNRNPNRMSRENLQSTPARESFSEQVPVSPINPTTGSNFSYPARAGGPPSTAGDDTLPQSPGTHSMSPGSQGAFENLRAAAKGIHGVGETLRGTLTNEIDNRFPRKNPLKAAAANAKNQGVLERGHKEMNEFQVER